MTPFPANLAALRPWTPIAADLLAATPIPPDFLPTTGADGSPTFSRTHNSPPRHIEFLGNTSLPRAAAPSLTADMDPGNSAALALGIGSGHEWPALLARMAPHQTLFLFDTNLPHVRMALEAADLTAPLSSGRLILLLGPAADDQLSAFLRTNPGFDVPTIMHQLPSLPSDQRNALRSAGEALLRRAITERTHLGTQLLARLADYTPAPNAAIVAFPATPQYLGQRLLWVALHAASTKKEIVALPADHHTSCSLLARLDAIAHYRPALIHADFFRTQLSTGGGGIPSNLAIHTWVPPLAPHIYFTDRLPAPSTLAPQDRVIVHSTEHASIFESLGFPKNAIHLVPIALAPNEISTSTHQDSSKHSAAPNTTLQLRTSIALIGDLYPIDPLSYGFELPSHQAIWESARTLLNEDLDSNSLPLAHRAADLLTRPGTAKVTLSEPHIIDALTRTFRHALIRTVTLISLARKLAAVNLSPQLIGRNWHLADLPNIPTTSFSRSAADMFASTSILLHADPAAIVDPLTLAAASSVTLVSLDHPHAARPGNLATLLTPNTDYLSIPLKFLLPTLRSLLADSPRRTSLTTSAHRTITTRHLWPYRGLPL